MSVTPVDQLRSALAVDSARPFTTFYDDATGERVELSVATFDNWVAKTANLLQDGLSAEPGQRLALLLPAHWQAQVWLLAAWSVGLVVDVQGDPADADVVVSGPDTLDAAQACPGERIALALRPMGGRFPQPPEGFLDYAAEVASYGDRFVPYEKPAPDAPALEVGGVVHTAAELADAQVAGLESGGRILTDLSFDTVDGIRAGLLAPLAAGTPVVLCRHLDPAQVKARVDMERVTVTVTRPVE